MKACCIPEGIIPLYSLPSTPTAVMRSTKGMQILKPLENNVPTTAIIGETKITY